MVDRVLGILGGMAWPSTAEAYRLLNEGVAAARGGTASAPVAVWSFDFAEVEGLQARGAWDEAGALLADGAVRLERAGVGALLLCTNTMHLVAPAIEEAVDVPLLHVADATAARVREVAPDARALGLLGTAFTMTEPRIVADRLRDHGFDVVVPDAEEREVVHRRIYDELIHGVVTPGGRADLIATAQATVADGAEVVLAGCTEIELALVAEDLDVPLVPTTGALVGAGLRWLLDGTRP